MGTDIPAYNHLLKLVDKGSLLIGLVAHLVGHLLVVSFTFFPLQDYRKILMMKTFAIVLSMLLFLGITIKANALPTSTKNSPPNCMMQVMYFDQCKQMQASTSL